jgi:hypothetical protein
MSPKTKIKPRDSQLSSSPILITREMIYTVVQPGKTKCGWRKWAGCWGRWKFCDYMVKLFEYIWKRTFENQLRRRAKHALAMGIPDFATVSCLMVDRIT